MMARHLLAARAFTAEKLPAQCDDLRQVQVVPLDLAVVDALEA